MNRPKVICFYGPESTGKSTLARKLAEHYHTTFVPEVAREMITSNNFTREDIIHIGNAQTMRMMIKARTANRVLFCDTDLITTAIYSDVYLHEVPKELDELEKSVHIDQYFLFDVDVPWVPDGMRDLGEKREEMFARFKRELNRRAISYILLSGDYAERERKVIAFVDALLARS